MEVAKPWRVELLYGAPMILDARGWVIVPANGINGMSIDERLETAHLIVDSVNEGGKV